MKKLKIIILGYGQRGGIYGQYALTYPEEFEVAAIVDTSSEKRGLAAENFTCPIYSDYRSMLTDKPVADIAVIATDDNMHEEHAIECMRAGYDLLLEKPISNKLESCKKIASAAKALNRKAVVCHVLRYTPFYRTVKEIIDSGRLGDIITVEASENVGYYHQAHSFVRGPWRCKEESSPMILAKCCHDMDILRWLIDKSCLSVSSFGGLSVFKPECAPTGAAKYCSECPLSDCIYKAQRLYLEHKWMAGYFNAGGLDDKEILKKLKGTQYDRCVYACDNDVVDHQVTIMQFEGGVTASHTMTAFSKEIYRDIKIHGTLAELYGVMKDDDEVEVRIYGGETVKIPIVTNSRVGGHGGGDSGLMHELYLSYNGQPTNGISYLDVSMESHFMSFSAEESRIFGGVPVSINRCKD